jgi:hypothetical protein
MEDVLGESKLEKEELKWTSFFLDTTHTVLSTIEEIIFF